MYCIPYSSTGSRALLVSTIPVQMQSISFRKDYMKDKAAAFQHHMFFYHVITIPYSATVFASSLVSV